MRLLFGYFGDNQQIDGPGVEINNDYIYEGYYSNGRFDGNGILNDILNQQYYIG